MSASLARTAGTTCTRGREHARYLPKYFAGCLVATAAAARAVPLGMPADGTNIFNFSYFASKPVHDVLAKRLPESIAELALDPENSLYVFNDHTQIGGDTICIARIGVSSRAQIGRNVRLPGHLFSTISFAGGASETAVRRCAASALEGAIAQLARADVSLLEQELLATKSEGGQNATRPPNPSMSAFTILGIQDRTQVAEAVPAPFRAIFDYRRVQWVVAAASFDYKGVAFCHVLVGLTTKSPENRAPRVPVVIKTRFGGIPVASAGKEGPDEQCKREVAVRAIHAYLSELSWDASGMFRDFAKTAEDGVGPPVLIERMPPLKRPAVPGVPGAPSEKPEDV